MVRRLFYYNQKCTLCIIQFFLILARTPLAFLHSFLVAGVINNYDMCWAYPCHKDLRDTVNKEIIILTKFCLLDIRFNHFMASDVAISILFWIRRKLNIKPLWNSNLTEITLGNPMKDLIIQSIIILLANEFQSNLPPPFSSNDESIYGSPEKSSNLYMEDLSECLNYTNQDSIFNDTQELQDAENDENASPTSSLKSPPVSRITRYLQSSCIISETTPTHELSSANGSASINGGLSLTVKNNYGNSGKTEENRTSPASIALIVSP
jgi:hypothetical protein